MKAYQIIDIGPRQGLAVCVVGSLNTDKLPTPWTQEAPKFTR
jgi:hypothetical protein